MKAGAIAQGLKAHPALAEGLSSGPSTLAHNLITAPGDHWHRHSSVHTALQ